MHLILKHVIAAFLILITFSGYSHASDYDKLTTQEKADLARYLGWVWGDGRPGYDGNGILYKGGDSNYSDTVKRLAQISFDGETNPFKFPVSGNLNLMTGWQYWDNSLPGGNSGDPQVLRDAIRHPNFLAGIIEGEGQIFHSDSTKDFYVADQSYSPGHPDKLYDIANFGPDRMVQFFRLLAETYGYSNPSISIGSKKYSYDTQFCEAVADIYEEYDRRREQNRNGQQVSGFTVRLYVNPPDLDEVRNYGYFERASGRFRTPAPDNRLNVIRSSLPDENVEANGPIRFFDNGSFSNPCSTQSSDQVGAGGIETSTANGQWQTFYFDAKAGDPINATVTWDDPSTKVRVYLRDENTNQVDRNTDGEGSATIRKTAKSNGRWSVGVAVDGGRVNYNVDVSR